MRCTVKLKNVELWIKTRSPLLITPSIKYLITSLIRLKMGDCFMEIKWPQRKTNSWELRIHNNTSSFNCKVKVPREQSPYMCTLLPKTEGQKTFEEHF